MTVQDWVYFFLGAGVLSLLAAVYSSRQAIGSGSGAAAMRQIAGAIKEGLEVFLKRQYKAVVVLMGLLLPAIAGAQDQSGGEASLKLPDLKSVIFTNVFGLNGHALLTWGLLFCAGGLLFGLAIYVQLKNLPVHRTMLEISDLIYETC